jgi:uncharacterized membrane-anchored protein
VNRDRCIDSILLQIDLIVSRECEVQSKVFYRTTLLTVTAIGRADGNFICQTSNFALPLSERDALIGHDFIALVDKASKFNERSSQLLVNFNDFMWINGLQDIIPSQDGVYLIEDYAPE